MALIGTATGIACVGSFLLSLLPRRRQILASGRRVKGGEAIARRRPVRAALDAVAASWTIGAEEDREPCTRPHTEWARLDLRARCGVWPGVRRADLLKAKPAAGAALIQNGLIRQYR